MKIKVGKYTLCSDSLSMWITEVRTASRGKNKGKETIQRASGYCSSLKNLSASFRDRKVGGSNAETIEELIEVLRDVYEDMVELNTVAVESGFDKLKRISKKVEDCGKAE